MYYVLLGKVNKKQVWHPRPLLFGGLPYFFETVGKKAKCQLIVRKMKYMPEIVN